MITSKDEGDNKMATKKITYEQNGKEYEVEFVHGYIAIDENDRYYIKVNNNDDRKWTKIYLDEIIDRDNIIHILSF